MTTTQQITLDDLAPGTGIYYTGDMANNDADGYVLKHIESDFGVQIVVTYPDNDKRDDRLTLTHFQAGPGRRFVRQVEHVADRERALDRMRADMIRLRQRKNSNA